ncbi:hypothetical protein D3C73_757760 [compost metagenome]
MHLTDGEVVEVEGEFRRHIWVRRLLVRQHDVEADRRRARFRCTTIARLHYAGAAAGDDDIFLVVELRRIFPAERGKFTRFVIIDGGCLEIVVLGLVMGCPGLLTGSGNTRATKQDHRRSDPLFGKDHLSLQKLQLQTKRPQLLAAEEILIGKGQAIGRRLRLRCLGLGSGSVLVGRAVLQRFPHLILISPRFRPSLRHADASFPRQPWLTPIHIDA